MNVLYMNDEIHNFYKLTSMIDYFIDFLPSDNSRYLFNSI